VFSPGPAVQTKLPGVDQFPSPNLFRGKRRHFVQYYRFWLKQNIRDGRLRYQPVISKSISTKQNISLKANINPVNTTDIDYGTLRINKDPREIISGLY
jgi:hypothetical protein